MKVQEYLKEHGLQALVDEFKIDVSDYPDRVVLNYNQINSPKYNPICDECRALILRKDTWEVMARSFDRFYNVGEGEGWKDFPVEQARIDEKLDGSLLSVYYDDDGWHPATRKKAFAEGGTAYGLDFNQLFEKAIEGTRVKEYLNYQLNTNFTYIFELTSPMNRIVTPYSETNVTLIGIRNNLNGFEVGKKSLDYVALHMDVARPKTFECKTFDELIEMANSLEAMNEGFVLVIEQEGSFRRLKCKNSKYLAIAHMRNNGIVSPRRILVLIMANEQEEYLQYFESDKKYFDLVKEIYDESLTRIVNLWSEVKDIEDQKEFALAVQGGTKHKHEQGICFKLRKGSVGLYRLIEDTDPKKLAKSLHLKEKFGKVFGIEEEED